MIQREAEVTWRGSLAGGSGTVRSETIGEVPYSFGTRFGDDTGYNPEEMIGAALASCFAMALAHVLAEAGHEPESLRASARVHLDPDTPAITGIDLSVEGSVPGLDEDTFRARAGDAKANCPVSRALDVAVDLTDATLTG